LTHYCVSALRSDQSFIIYKLLSCTLREPCTAFKLQQKYC
jgi:hypothetical protein